MVKKAPSRGKLSASGETWRRRGETPPHRSQGGCVHQGVGAGCSRMGPHQREGHVPTGGIQLAHHGCPACHLVVGGGGTINVAQRTDSHRDETQIYIKAPVYCVQAGRGLVSAHRLVTWDRSQSVVGRHHRRRSDIFCVTVTHCDVEYGI